MMATVNTRAGLRPIRSPKCATTSPPSGRAKNPTAKVANAASEPTRGLTEGKYSRLMNSAAAAP